MRWVRFSVDGRSAYGLVEDNAVVEVSGDPFAGYERTSTTHGLDAIKIEVPVIPRTFYAVGLNYTDHLPAGAAIPDKPDVGYRAVNALVAHEEPVVIPKDASEQVQYEGELVVVIGREAKHLGESEALSCVLGYTIGNDVSERTWQAMDRTLWRAKNTDTFKPMGPWIETSVDPDALETVVRVNGVELSRFATNNMLYGVATYIATMSSYLTLYPGDVIWMGTDGVSPNLVHGDVVEVEITGIGTLRNEFVTESA